MIAIVDYGLGNVKAFANVYRNLNIPAQILGRPNELLNASKVILPGVGAFDYAMQTLENSGLRQSLDEIVLQRKVPVLGICVGMHMLAHSSDEGSLPGLGWIDGVVKKLDLSFSTRHFCIPHMGWNNVNPLISKGLFKGLDHDARFYFLHSYYFHCEREADSVAVTDYGGLFSSSVQSENIFGVQFHPEKSHHFGIQLLKNFALI